MDSKRARLTLAILFAINAMNFFDRQILGAVGEQIRKEWSFLVGGYMAKTYGWQTAFLLAALPGILCAIAALWLIEEPKRGAAEAHDIGAVRRAGSPFKLVLSIPSMWPIVISGALHNFNM